MSTREQEQAIEREQVAWVFGLTGGELETEPWNGYAYNYTGVPDYCERGERKVWDWPQARTVIVTGGGFLPIPKPWLVDDEGAWVLVATYTSSGECECPGTQDTEGNTVYYSQCGDSADPDKAHCVLCEEKLGTPHGYIYIGEGYEAVYSLVEESTKSREEWEQERGEGEVQG